VVSMDKCLARPRPQLNKAASGTILIMSLVLRGQGSNIRPPAHGANTLPLI